MISLCNLCVDTVALNIEHVHVKYAASIQCLSRYSSQPYLHCKLATHQACNLIHEDYATLLHES